MHSTDTAGSSHTTRHVCFYVTLAAIRDALQPSTYLVGLCIHHHICLQHGIWAAHHVVHSTIERLLCGMNMHVQRPRRKQTIHGVQGSSRRQEARWDAG